MTAAATGVRGRRADPGLRGRDGEEILVGCSSGRGGPLFPRPRAGRGAGAQVQEATGFEVLLPEGEIPETAPPREEELALLRDVIDPTGMRRWEFRHQ